ncbi:MAG: response regulator [Syntrophobacteraceae bacterium]|jgi:response regulator RpfG family c-di-GMP phosphodiesterase|nr:response regulator [Syntrophobacteraceae bacterium]
MKILIVEDDAILSELLREYLQQLDHEKVQVCASGSEVVNWFNGSLSEYFDCAFIDLKLPDIDGLELLDLIKARDPALPVVMMSGYSTMNYTIEAMRKGASDFLPKPFTVQDMALALERVTKERKLLLENLSLKLECQTRKQLEVVNRELQDSIAEQVRLFEIAGEIDEIRSSEDLYPKIVKIASRVTDGKKTGFFILPPDHQHMILISDCGLEGYYAGPRLFDLPSEGLREVLGRAGGHVVLPLDDLLRPGEPGGSAGVKEAFSCWPLRIRGELFGFLAASFNGGGRGPVRAEVKLLDFLVKKAALAIENMALYESMINNFYAILRSLVNALEAKDLYTGKHSERVTYYAHSIGLAMGCSMTEIEALQTVGYLHDIGKIGIADSILNKAGALTADELELIKKHPVIGETIVSELGLSPEERAIIRHHHERWDGGGYPDGLSRHEIPLLARIIMVADSYDAMTSKRAYRNAMSRDEALRELKANRSKQFDAEVVDAFVDWFRSSGSGE